MFATGIPELGLSFFTAATMMIAVPSGVQIFCWIATLWAGRLRLGTPLLFLLGFVFVLGGLTGVMQASVPLDLQVHDTYFVVAHFHYVLIGGAVFPLLGGFYYWFPKFTGRVLSERAGRWNFWLLFAGFNLTFFPMHQLGLAGMPRRVYTYLPETGWGRLNLVATVAGPEPLWERAGEPIYVTGVRADVREVLVTRALDAEPDHRSKFPEPSPWPFLTAVAAWGLFVGSIFTPWAVPVGSVPLFVALVSPLHPLGEALFSAHMTQHEVLMLVAAPLLVLGRLLIPFLWALPLRWRRREGRAARAGWVQGAWRGLTNPLASWAVHALALWAWHVPALFEATLESDLVHSLQHASFLGSALLFWWALIHGRRVLLGYGAAVLYVFTTALHSGLLGALLIFAGNLWYPA